MTEKVTSAPAIVTGCFGVVSTSLTGLLRTFIPGFSRPPTDNL